MDRYGRIVVVRTNEDVDELWSLVPTENSPLWPIVSCDFNGVLDEYEGWSWIQPRLRAYKYHNEPTFIDHPIHPKARWFLEQLSERYNSIVVCSATRPIDYVAEWLLFNHLDDLVDFVTNFKLPGVDYIDDRGVRHNGNHKETINCLGKKAHWEK